MTMRKAAFQPEPPVPAVNRKGTVLAIDDEEIMREILDALLTREGYDVRIASGAAEGLELARSM
jgi:CheY-like chemotaxis protein